MAAADARRPSPAATGEPWSIAKVYWTALPKSVLQRGIDALRARRATRRSSTASSRPTTCRCGNRRRRGHRRASTAAPSPRQKDAAMRAHADPDRGRRAVLRAVEQPRPGDARRRVLPAGARGLRPVGATPTAARPTCSPASRREQRRRPRPRRRSAPTVAHPRRIDWLCWRRSARCAARGCTRGASSPILRRHDDRAGHRRRWPWATSCCLPLWARAGRLDGARRGAARSCAGWSPCSALALVTAARGRPVRARRRRRSSGVVLRRCCSAAPWPASRSSSYCSGAGAPAQPPVVRAAPRRGDRTHDGRISR